MSDMSQLNAPITRREAIRRAVVFSSGAWAATRFGGTLQAKETAAKLGNGMHLLAFGDFGTKGNEAQTSVANQMAAFARSLDERPAAVLALGDNFYNEIKPGRIEEHFEKMYSKEDLDCPFYVCAGNHDYGTAKYDFQEGKLQMQLDYARENPDSRWKFPSKWYSVELPSPENPLVKIIVLDGGYWEGALTPQEKIAQRRWLKAEFEKKSKAPWLWMVNHYPLFSEAVNRGDNKRLIEEWGQQLNDHDVSLAFAGHDHTLQHLQVEGYKPSFIVSGAGGARLYDCRTPPRGFVSNHVFGFNHVHVTPKLLTVQYIDAQGRLLHAFTRDRAGKVKVVTQQEPATADAAG